MLLRVDDVVQALRKESEQSSAPVPPEEMESWKKYLLYTTFSFHIDDPYFATSRGDSIRK